MSCFFLDPRHSHTAGLIHVIFYLIFSLAFGEWRMVILEPDTDQMYLIHQNYEQRLFVPEMELQLVIGL